MSNIDQVTFARSTRDGAIFEVINYAVLRRDKSTSRIVRLGGGRFAPISTEDNRNLIPVTDTELTSRWRRVFGDSIASALDRLEAERKP